MRRLLLMLLVLVTSLIGSTIVACGAPAAPSIPGFAAADLGPGGLVNYPGPARIWTDRNPRDPRTPAIRRAIADHPAALWLTGNTDADVNHLRTAAQIADRTNGTIQLVLYNLPGRNDAIAPPNRAVVAAGYRSWVNRISAELGNRRAIVVVEPDALWFVDRQYKRDPRGRTERLDLIKYVTDRLSHQNRTRVYIEAGTSSGSVTPKRMAELLAAAGASADVGFAVNVSSFGPPTQIENYAQGIRNALRTSHRIANPRYLVDTSRNGNPRWDYTWCNPAGRQIGSLPRVVGGASGRDYNLWVKGPGDSDGPCGTAPFSVGGQFLPDVAAGMIARSGGR
ncbi:glycoside hydrolase family 6 protein [Gordonia soli]|uniref:Glucanase n=1 Tax=Gordonia soli NBRC 108243 TaxID=1223545 RepID=M0QL86_9ACTN|nr:glycoside hydrolase family 6 protein [Gordonia soli]GAC69194.1 putative glucanase [Gordonia soli NBRC 108243]